MGRPLEKGHRGEGSSHCPHTGHLSALPLVWGGALLGKTCPLQPAEDPLRGDTGSHKFYVQASGD